ncbi:hypothetical protein JOC25_003640 [Solibacillus kalamii]|uniref:Uncharacterized protein n=1 Tax=Solibacillus kalamii TaxID=1748298 RepID=A0ABX3ZG28_9BACL|nr:hypothetical protein [Solibacillus kalamii]MBM7667113.1 hypothetical protein [Solibacillus kalamii]OUZ38254.1 hypothetical protein CBM15_14320 [Solibacillus kalamii]
MILEELDTILELSYRLLEDQSLILEQTFLLLETPCYIRTFRFILAHPASLLENATPPKQQKTAAQFQSLSAVLKLENQAN